MVRDRRGQRLKAPEDRLFSGEFWAGAKAIGLGLADSEGELRQVMRDRFGKRVRLRRLQGPKRLLRRLVGRGRTDRGLPLWAGDRKSVVEGKSGAGRVDLGGRRIIKKKKTKKSK